MIRAGLSVFFLLLFSCASGPLRKPAELPAEKPLVSVFQAPSGVFQVEVMWSLNPELGSDVLQGKLSFAPAPNKSRCDKIGFVQIARVTQENGENYHWDMAEKPRNEIAIRGETPASNGFYVDHLGEHCQRGRQCSPYFADHWPNEGQSAFGRAEKISGTKVTLTDYPFGWTEFRSIELEACALCVQSQAAYGCVLWGGEWPATAPRRVQKPAFRPRPSATFQKALENFKQYYGP